MSEGRHQRHRREREDDLRLGAIFADQLVDPADVARILLDCRDAKLVPRRVEFLVRDGPPEHLARRLVVPDLRQPEGEDEHVGLEEDVAGRLADILAIPERLSVEAVPQFNLRHLVLHRPLELPKDCERVHHAFRADDDVGVALLLGEDVVFAFVQPGRDVLGEARPEGGNVDRWRDGGRFRRPVLDDVALDRVRAFEIHHVRSEARVFPAIPGIIRPLVAPHGAGLGILAPDRTLPSRQTDDTHSAVLRARKCRPFIEQLIAKRKPMVEAAGLMPARSAAGGAGCAQRRACRPRR